MIKRTYYGLLLMGVLLLGGCDRMSTTEEQISEISDQIREDPTNVDLYFKRSELYSELSLHTRNPRWNRGAEFDLDKVLEIDPKNKEAFQEKGMIAMVE